MPPGARLRVLSVPRSRPAAVEPKCPRLNGADRQQPGRRPGILREPRAISGSGSNDHAHTGHHLCRESRVHCCGSLASGLVSGSRELLQRTGWRRGPRSGVRGPLDFANGQFAGRRSSRLGARPGVQAGQAVCSQAVYRALNVMAKNILHVPVWPAPAGLDRGRSGGCKPEPGQTTPTAALVSRADLVHVQSPVDADASPGADVSTPVCRSARLFAPLRKRHSRASPRVCQAV